ncbi:hypothetical protein D3C81_1810640 [compost metagenome]
MGESSACASHLTLGVPGSDSLRQARKTSTVSASVSVISMTSNVSALDSRISEGASVASMRSSTCSSRVRPAAGAMPDNVSALSGCWGGVPSSPSIRSASSSSGVRAMLSSSTRWARAQFFQDAVRSRNRKFHQRPA